MHKCTKSVVNCGIVSVDVKHYRTGGSWVSDHSYCLFMQGTEATQHSRFVWTHGMQSSPPLIIPKFFTPVALQNNYRHHSGTRTTLNNIPIWKRDSVTNDSMGTDIIAGHTNCVQCICQSCSIHWSGKCLFVWGPASHEYIWMDIVIDDWSLHSVKRVSTQNAAI